MSAGSSRGPLRRRVVVQLLAGPLLTLACAAVVEALRGSPLHFPGPAVPLLIAVACATFLGGFVPGFASTAIAIGYAAYYYATMAPAGITPDEWRRLLDLAVGSAVLAGLFGVLRRRAELAHRRAMHAALEAEYQIVFEEAADPLLLTDITGRYVFVNQRACEMTGYAREELLRMRTGELFLPDTSGGRRRTDLAPRGPGRLHTDVDLLRRDGTRLRVDLSVCRLSDGRVLKIVRDVSEQRASVERLQNALSLVRATLDSTTDGILVVDVAGHWVDHNARFRQIWGIPDSIARSGDDQRALDFVVGQLADPEGFLIRVRELYATPEETSHDEIRMRDGRVLERESIPQRLGERTIGRVWSFRDVTESRRQAEALRETERRFIEAEKLEAVGRLAGGVAHDFNNMLTAILGEADLLLLQNAVDGKARAQVENIRSAALRSARLTRHLLAFARRQHHAPRAFALSELLDGLDPLVRRLAGRQVDVRVHLPEGGGGPWVDADPTQLEQAILNLVINAGDAMPDGGQLTLRLCREQLTDADATRRGAPAPGRYACVCVEDTGTGISDDVRPHLFEPFFTTKPPGKGTGLGLASVHGIVQQANGFVEVASELGNGSLFRVMLPEVEPVAVLGAPHTAPSAPALPTAPAATRVLVVEDEDAVRTLVVAVLAEAGFDVLQATNADAAYAIADHDDDAIHLLLSDVLLPGAHGPEVARRLLAARRVRRVLFMTGFAGRALDGDAATWSGVEVVSKPFTPTALVEAVRRALAGPESSVSA